MVYDAMPNAVSIGDLDLFILLRARTNVNTMLALGLLSRAGSAG